MIQIHDHGKIIEVEPSDKSQLTRGIMRSSELLLSFRSDVVLDLHAGATVDFEGETFTLIYPSELRKLWRGYYDYTVTMHSSAELLKQRLLKDPSEPGRTAFTFTGSAHDFATLVARSMGEGWSVGDCMVSDGDRMIAFREETCLGALARIAEDFHSEWVVERQTVAIRKQELWRDDPVRMSYGKGKGFLSGVSRSGDGDKLPISRLYVLGGSRNIDPAAYGSRSLHLPDGSTALSSGVEGREAALDLSHIYPSRVGTISEVVTVSEEKCFYDIKDASIPAELNYSDCRIPGEKAVIRFQSGALAGRELEIRQSETALEGYHHEERRFELVPREEDGFTFPSARWMPKAGDRYAVFGISLPPTYVKEAEERMLREAKRYLGDNMEPVYTFRGEVDGIWARKHWLEVGGKLVPGGHVLFSDPEFHPSGSVIRIVSTTQAVNDPHAPSITLSTAPVPGSFLSRLDRVEADEVVRREQVREVQRQQSQSYRQALEHLSMVDRAVEGLEGFTRRLKPSVIETMGILVGSQATQLDFVRAVGSLESVTPAVNFDPSTKALHIGEAVLRHQTIGITTVKDKRDPSEYRYWRLPEYVSPPLTDPDRSYYIYARAARVGTEGAFLLSEEPIPMESDPDHFHLLIGTLSSLDGGDRAYNRLYGFSMISPGQMVVDTISSANGRMSIDLARGEIYASSVSFSRPDGARGSLSDLAGEVDELQSHPPKIVEGKWHVWDGKAQTYVNTGDDARGETGVNGLAPRVSATGIWEVWDGTAWISTGTPARGAKGEKGDKGEQGAPGKDVDPKVLNDLKTAVDNAEKKLKDTVTKAELDGVVTAQEEKDIKAAEAARNAAKEAYDSAVKKAKELDAEIQVGGRNLAIMSRMIPGYLYGDTRHGDPGDKDYKVIQYKDFVHDPTYHEWDGATPLTYKLIKGGKQTPIIHYHDKDKVFIGWFFSWDEFPAGYTRTLTPPAETAYIRIGFPCSNPVVKIERGTVATDWTPAPEDVQAEIDKATEQATKAQTSTDKLRGYVDGAYKDGIITEMESKAIKTYIQEVDAQWQSALGAYEKVYTNALLTGTPKTALLDCKTTLAGKVSDLTGYITTAISDGKATAAEVTETGRRYTAYKTALRDFQKTLKVAEEAIRYATVGEVGSGSLNYFPTDVVKTDTNRAIWRLKLASGFFRAVPVGVEVPINIGYDVYFDNDRTDNKVKTTFFYTDEKDNYSQGSRRYIHYSITTGLKGRAWHHIWKSGKVARLDKHVRIMGWLADTVDTGTYPSEVRDVYLRVGSRDLGWTPAPEDVQAEIDAINANPPRISAGGTWEVYVPKADKYIDTGRTSKGDNGKAPKIVNGNWYEWDAALGRYTDTGVKAIGTDGKDGAPGKKGEKGDKGDKGDGLEVIDTRNDNQPPSWYRTKYALTTVREFKILNKIGIPSKWWSGSYCTLETTVRWADTSGGRVEQSTTLDNGCQLRRVGTADDTAWEPWINVSAEVREVATGLSSATTLIESLQRAQDLKLDRNEMPEIGYLLAALKKPKGTTVAGGLLLSNQIILSDAEDDIISATLSGQRAKGAKSLRLGIDYADGKDAGTEQTALCNDGTGHLGELYFGGREISFGSDPTKRYMQIGGMTKSESEMVSASTKPGVFALSGCSSSVSGPIVVDSFVSDFAGQEVRYTATLTASAKAFATLVRRPLPHGSSQDTSGQDVYIGQTAESRGFLRLTISRGGSIVRTIDSVSVSATATAQGGTVPSGQPLPFGSDNRKSTDTNEVTLSLPGDTIRRGDSISLVLVTTVFHRPLGSYAGMDDYPEGYAYDHSCDVSDVLCRRPIDTSRPMVSIAEDKAAFFYGRSSYILLNYLRDCVMKVVGNMIIQGNLTVKGDIKQEGGGFLAGGVISTSGSMYRWVGKRLSVRQIGTGRYKITHNIGHTNYCIQAIPVNDSDWNAFVISGTETSSAVEIGVQWNGGWRNGAIHFAIFAQ